MHIPDLGRWALVGLEPEGRHILERWSLRNDFPFVAVCDPSGPRLDQAAKFGLRMVPSVTELLADPQIDGVVLTLPLARRTDVIRVALAAGKRILVEGQLCDTASEARRIAELSQAAAAIIGVFHVRRSDPDFHAALSAIAGGRLGELRSVRWIDCEYGLLAGGTRPIARPTWTEALQRTGPLLFDQLAQLIAGMPQTVQAWPSPDTAGYQLRLDYPSQRCAWIEVQRASLTGLQTGWVLEGTTGAYRHGRVWTLAADGELLEEDVSPALGVDDDVFTDLRCLAATEAASRASFLRAWHTVALLEGIQQSAGANQPVSLDIAERATSEKSRSLP